MESQAEETSQETDQSRQIASSGSLTALLMAEESGISQPQQPMSTCTLEKVTLETMNETNDLSRPPSGSIADLEEGPASSKRIKVDEGEIPIKPAPSTTKTSVHIEVAPSVSIGTSKGKPGTSSSSDMTPQATITSISEGSSEMSLEAKHAAHSRPSSSAQLAPTDNDTKPSSSSLLESNDPKKKALHPKAASTALAPSEPLPIKSLTMMHLHKKYTAELDYMLREFRKLERQLLGAKGNGVEENAGSRERREKLHSFILHLESTLQQIQLGVRLEAEGKSTVMVGVTVGEVGGKITTPTEEEVKQQLANMGALANLTKEKEEEENVQKLEEHILANLLPVKVRLKKQLAAQQGATRNPVGMPVARRGMLPSASAEKGTGTFAAAAEKKRQQAEAAAAEDETQFGKPLTGGASSLTQKLHGQTLGSAKRKYGHGVGSEDPAPEAEGNVASAADGKPPPQKRKILYAGMAPGSKQLKSGVSAATGVHKMVMETPSLYPKAAKASKAQAAVPEPVLSASIKSSKPAALPQHARGSASKAGASHPGQKIAARQSAASRSGAGAAPKKKKRQDDPTLTEEERKKLRKLRKRKKRRKIAKQRERERQLHILRQQQSAHVPGKAGSGKKVKMSAKGQGKKKGPRTVEYICALCSESYGSTCECNPWWALTHHDCPKCRKAQVPRVDITAPANAIEYHPALLAHAEEGGSGGGGSGANGPGVMHINPSHIPSSATFPVSRRYPAVPMSDSDSGSDLSDISDGDLSDDSLDSDFDELENMGALSPAEQAENELFGMEYNGPKLTDDETSRLLVLMSHASTCPGRHKHAKHRDVCSSVKYMMLHVRDCPGTTASFDICPFPWCRKVKHSLYHMVSCVRPKDCPICSNKELSPNLTALIGLNDHRRKKQKERRAAAMAAAAAAAKAKPPPRPAPRSAKGTAAPKAPYKPPATRPGAVKKGALSVPDPPRRSVPGNVPPKSAVAIAAAAAAAGVSKVVLPQTNSAVKPPLTQSMASKPSSSPASKDVPVATVSPSQAKPAVAMARPVPASAVKAEVEATGRTAPATAKPSSGVQPRTVTAESDGKEAPAAAAVPEKGDAASPVPENVAKIEHASVPVKAESTEPGADASEPATKVKGEDVPVVKHEAREHHNEADCLGDCCAESRAVSCKLEENASETIAEPTVPTSTSDEKSQAATRSPDSAELSRSSSCSDEVNTKNSDVVRISC